LATAASSFLRLRTIPGFLHQLFDARQIEGGHLNRIEPGQGPPVALPLAQDGQPAQPRLSPFQDQELEQDALLVHRHAPLAVVVEPVLRRL
jgi:hypothetical protein